MLKLEIYRAANRIGSINHLKNEAAADLIEDIEDGLQCRKSFIKLTLGKNNIMWIPSSLLRESMIHLKEERGPDQKDVIVETIKL